MSYWRAAKVVRNRNIVLFRLTWQMLRVPVCVCVLTTSVVFEPLMTANKVLKSCLFENRLFFVFFLIPLSLAVLHSCCR